jgi:hypothetical protein
MKEEYPLRSWLANENLPLRGIAWRELRRYIGLTRWTFWALSPLSLGMTSKETSSPSFKVLNPAPVMDV